MFFINQSKDTPLLQEIIREGVINAGLWESLTMPAEGYLIDVLVANVAKIPSNPWIDWLVRKHACTRIPAMEPTPAFIKAIERTLLGECLKADCYPIQVGENHLYVGIGRPDYPEVAEKLLKYYKKSILYRNSMTINEISRLRLFCHQALQSM